MSKNYNAAQFESSYKPKILRNWEVPKLYTTTPRKRIGKTRIIVNDRGHILPDIKKIKKPPWSDFKSTWNLPKKINRKIAENLNCTNLENTSNKFSLDHTTDEEIDNNNKEIEKSVPYVPGDLTEEKHRPESYTQLLQNRFNNLESQARPHPGFPKYQDEFSRKSPTAEKTLDEQVDEILKNSSNNKESERNSRNKQEENRMLSPIINAISNFNFAKKLHKENLEHNPLPDTITDSIYRKLQMQKTLQQDPGLSLEEKNFACGVGWKGYPGYGPTKCTKLKVYRPKTCAHHPTNKKDIEDNNNIRPNTVSSFDQKWRFIRQNKVTPIDLAIYWDLTPENVEDEPKPPQHLDGSNGSLAPAVFSLVHTPKNGDPHEKSISKCAPIFEQGPNNESLQKDFIFDRPKTSSSKKLSNESKRRTKSAYDLTNKNQAVLEANLLDQEIKKNCYKSTPNLANKLPPNDAPCTKHSCKKLAGRLCVACELADFPEQTNKNNKAKTEYKMAFKAGVPQNKYNSKRGEDYPEHWRLTTVYQHSYKPFHTRKRSLLQTVYK